MYWLESTVISNSLFFRTKQYKHNQSLDFSGKLKKSDADTMLQTITTDKNAKDFKLDL